MTASLTTDTIPQITKPRSGELTVRVLRTLPEIEEMRPSWSSWNAHPNCDLDFYLLLLNSKPEIERPHVIVVYRGQQPAAMLVGRIVRRPVDFKIGYARILKTKARLLYFVYGGTLGDFSPDTVRHVLQSILMSLRNGEADSANLNFIRTDCPLYKEALELPGFLSRDRFSSTQQHISMTLPSTPEELYRNLSPKTRQNHRRKARRFEEQFPDARIACFKDTDDLERMTADIEEVAKKTYQRGLGTGFASNEETRLLLRFQAQKGWLHAYVLYVAGQPCSFWLGTVYSHTFHGNSFGYDPAYARFSPGMYLLIRGIEDLCSQRETHNIQVIDFGLGDAGYKQQLGDTTWEESSPWIFAPSFRGLWLNLLRTPTALADRFARTTIEQIGSASDVKRTWRRLLKRAAREERN
jgi:hypothetical protein